MQTTHERINDATHNETKDITIYDNACNVDVNTIEHAPLQTQSLTHVRRNDATHKYACDVDPPQYCHTFKATTPSSRRMHKAAIAYKKEACKLIKRKTKHRQDRNNCKKNSR